MLDIVTNENDLKSQLYSALSKLDQLEIDEKNVRSARAYKYVCDKCGYFEWENRTNCEGCGRNNTLRKVTKKDWKKIQLSEEIKKINRFEEFFR